MPQAPDPAVTIPLQTAANKDFFNYALEAQRVNQYSPYGSQIWEKTPTFDRAGYREALGEWRDNKPEGGYGATPNPSTPGTGPGYWAADPNSDGGTGQTWVSTGSGSGASGGYAAGDPNSLANARPDKADFTTNSWTYRQNLSPEQQAIFDANRRASLGQASTLDALTQRVQAMAGQEIDWGSVPGLERFERGDEFANLMQGLAGQLGELDPSQFNRRAANALYRQNTRYLDEQRGNEQSALEARLAEQGFVPGTPGYDKAMETFQDTGNRAYADARDRSITMGTQVGSQNFTNDLNRLGRLAGVYGQDFNQELTGLQTNNTARTQGLAELLQQRMMPLNELNAMRTGTQVTVPNNPAQYSTPNISAPDIIGAYNTNYGNQVQQYSNQVAGDNGMLGMFGDMAGMAMGAPPGTFSTLMNGFGGGSAPQAGAYGMPTGNFFG